MKWIEIYKENKVEYKYFYINIKYGICFYFHTDSNIFGAQDE